MSVWLCIPSKRAPSEANPVLQKWRDMGYKIALFVDREDEHIEKICDFRGVGNYPGYGAAINGLIRNVADFDSKAEWFVTGGDDTEPDSAHTAEEIAQACANHFSVNFYRRDAPHPELEGLSLERTSTFGVMQPTGDRWGEERGSAYIDRVAGSPWLGREFCQRMYGGRGPYFEEYRHMFDDEELQNVATMLGVFWQRPDIVHLHNHWGRIPGQQVPEFLRVVNSPTHWARVQSLFKARKVQGFPGHEPA